MILTQHDMNSILRAKGPSYGSVVIGDKTYRTVIIGNQEWIVENLDWAWACLDVGSGGTSSETPRANYYDNDETTYGWNGRKCGFLYNWPAVHYLDENSDVMLPDGWRVATRDDWDALAEAVGGDTDAGTKLKSANVPWTIQTDSWGGTDDYHFEALPAGYIGTSFVGSGICTYFWTSNDEPNFNAIAYCSYMSEGASLGSYSNEKYYQLSVRLVKNLS